MNRRAFLASSATFAASTGASASPSIPGGTHLVERHADFEAAVFERAVGRPAAVRQVVEAIAFRPGALGSVLNAMNGLQFGFAYSPEAIAVVLAAHGASAVYGYSDYLWTKYRLGEFFKLADAAGNPIVTNVFLAKRAPYDPNADPDDPAGMYHDASVEMLQRRGVVVLTCHTAVEEQARAIVSRSFAPEGATAADVAADILTHLIPGAIVVPSMVAAIAVLQNTYRYTYRLDA